jgi:hypothetical protein
VDSPRGDCLKPYSESEIREKFRDLASDVLTADGIAEVERLFDRFEEWKSAGELTAVLRRGAKS